MAGNLPGAEVNLGEVFTAALLLKVIGWVLVSLVVRDVIMTARQSLAGPARQRARALYYRSANYWIVLSLMSMARAVGLERSILSHLNWLLPVLQFVVWKTGMLVGFASVYVAVAWQTSGGQISDHLFAAFGLSMAVSFRIALDGLAIADPSVLLVANIHLYLGLLFFVVFAIYVVILSRRSRHLYPSLFGIDRAEDDVDDPFSLAEELRDTFGPNQSLVVLQYWEDWAQRLRILLQAHPHFIYSGARDGEQRSWLIALSLILDVTAALAVRSGGAMSRQALYTVNAARRTSVETSEYLGLRTHDRIVGTDFLDQYPTEPGESILSTKLISETELAGSSSDREAELLSIWRLTYQPALKNLAEHLRAPLPDLTPIRKHTS